MNITYEKVQDLSATVLLRFQQGLEGYKPVSTEIAPEIVSTGIGNIYPLGRVPAIREWIGDRQVEQIGEAKYMLENKLFESTITVPRTALEDDNYGFYLYQTTAQAKEAQQHPDVMLATAIMEGFSTGLAFDGVSFFSAAHPWGPNDATQSNYTAGTGEPWVLVDGSKAMPAFFHQKRTAYAMERPADISESTFMRDEYLFGIRGRGAIGYGLWQLAHGSKAELTADSYKAASNAMMKIKKHNGNSVGAMPTHIVVGPDNYEKAIELFRSVTIGGSSNTLIDRVKIVVLPWLAADSSSSGGGNGDTGTQSQALKVAAKAKENIVKENKTDLIEENLKEDGTLVVDEIVEEDGKSLIVRVGNTEFVVDKSQVREDKSLTKGGVNKYNQAKKELEGGK